jgi:hypothetical protein
LGESKGSLKMSHKVRAKNMKKKRTRLQKERAKIRKLQRENANLKVDNQVLQERVNKEIQDTTENIHGKRMKKMYTNIYDILISTVMLVFTYWVVIENHEKSNVHYYCFLILAVLISLKCFINTDTSIKSVLRVIGGDLLKPFVSMVLGVVVCTLCLKDEWRNVRSYALDTADMLILISAVVIFVLVFFVMTRLLLILKNILWKKEFINLR